MDVKLFVNGKEIAINEFVKKILGGMVSGAILSLRDIEEEWKDIQITVTK
jgi:hypothetical protein